MLSHCKSIEPLYSFRRQSGRARRFRLGRGRRGALAQKGTPREDEALTWLPGALYAILSRSLNSSTIPRRLREVKSPNGVSHIHFSSSLRTAAICRQLRLTVAKKPNAKYGENFPHWAGGLGRLNLILSFLSAAYF